MAGRGPKPKDPEARARTNSDPIPETRLPLVKATQPELPRRMPNGQPWPARTRAWWRNWGKSPLTTRFTSTDWSALLDTAVLHGLYWSGDVKVAGELRLREAKFGATGEDRARLRINLVDETPAEPSAKPPAGGSRGRYAGLKLVG